MRIILFLIFTTKLIFGNSPEQIKFDGFPVNLWIGHKVIQNDNKYSSKADNKNNFDYFSHISNIKNNKNLLFFLKLFFILFLIKKFYYFLKKDLEKNKISIENDLIIYCCCYLNDNDFENFFELNLKKIINFSENNFYKVNLLDSLKKILAFKENLILLENKKFFILFYKIFFIKNNLTNLFKKKQKIINNLNKFIEKIIKEINLD